MADEKNPKIGKIPRSRRLYDDDFFTCAQRLGTPMTGMIVKGDAIGGTSFDCVQNRISDGSFEATPEETWGKFAAMLEKIEGTSETFLRLCFFTTDDEGYTLFHYVCSANPPLQVVETFICLIPHDHRHISNITISHARVRQHTLCTWL